MVEVDPSRPSRELDIMHRMIFMSTHEMDL